MAIKAPRPDLTQILADVRGDAAVLRRNGQLTLAENMEAIASRVADATDEYASWLGELECANRSGWKIETVKRWARKFGESEHVRWTRGVGYEMRACIVPRRAEASLIAASAHRKAG